MQTVYPESFLYEHLCPGKKYRNIGFDLKAGLAWQIVYKNILLTCTHLVKNKLLLIFNMLYKNIIKFTSLMNTNTFLMRF